jgi:hypothetical protein
MSELTTIGVSFPLVDRRPNISLQIFGASDLRVNLPVLDFFSPEWSASRVDHLIQ